MKKGLNGLTARTDRRTEAVTRKKCVIFFLLSGGNNSNFTIFTHKLNPVSIAIGLICKKSPVGNWRTVKVYLPGCVQVGQGRSTDLSCHEEGDSIGAEHHKSREFTAVIPLLSGRAVTLAAKLLSHFGVAAVRASGRHNRVGIHCVTPGIFCLGQGFFRPDLRQSPEGGRQPVQSPAERLITWKGWKPLQKVAFGVVVNRLPRR